MPVAVSIKKNGAYAPSASAAIKVKQNGVYGDFLGVKVKGNGAYGNVGVAPSNTTPPVIAGTGAVGSTLTCTPGTWSGAPAPTKSYQWLRDGTVISGATGLTYLLVAGDAGANIAVRETASNVVGSANVVSNAIAVV